MTSTSTSIMPLRRGLAALAHKIPRPHPLRPWISPCPPCPSCRLPLRTYLTLTSPAQSRLSYCSVPQVRPRPFHRTVFIQTSPTPNDQALKFTPTEHTLLPPNTPTVEFLSTSPSVPSPLARHILAIPGVRSVMFSPEFLTVEKEEDAQWSHIKPEVFSLTMEHLLSGQDLLTDPVAERTDTAIQPGDSETVQMIKELLETRIRPAIMEDGGDIEYRGFNKENGEVQLKLRGACRTCDSSVVTLKNGIEAMMRHYIPEVQSVLQVMDDEEEIALKEFEKLEAKLSSKTSSEAESKSA